MRSHLLVLLIFSLAPSYSYMYMFRRAPTLAEIPDEPPILHLRGFDIWRNRVIGNGWDIQENLIRGPGGFYWQKNEATDTPPSLPPPLNEIVWCPGCFLEKAYGSPTWSVDMSRFRREPTLMDYPNINDFQKKQTINMPVPHQRYLQFPWQQRYMAPQTLFFMPGMLPSRYNVMPPLVMPQFPYQRMPNSNPFMFNRPPYGMPFPHPNEIFFMNQNEPNLNQELPSEDNDALLSPKEMAPLPNDAAKISTPYPDTVPFPKNEPIFPGEQINLQNNEAKHPSEGQTPSPKIEEDLLTPPPKIELDESEEGRYTPLSDMSKLPLKEETQPPKIEDNLLTSPPNLTLPPKIELAESEKGHNTPLSDMSKLSPIGETQPPKNEDNLLTSSPNITPPPKIELAESEEPLNDMSKLPPIGETLPPKIEDNHLTLLPNIIPPPKIELAESEKEISTPNDMTKLSPNEVTQPPKNEDTLLISPPNLAQGSTRKNVPSSRSRKNWRSLASKALQANRASKNPTKSDQGVPTKGLDSNEVLDKAIPDKTDNYSNVKQDSSVGENTEDNNILDPVFDFVSTLFSSNPSDQAKPTPLDPELAKGKDANPTPLDFQNSMRDPELAKGKDAKPTPLDFQNSMRDLDLAKGNGLKNKNTPLKGEENVDTNAPVKYDFLSAVGQPEDNISKSGDQTVPKTQQHPQQEIGSDVENNKQKDNSANVKKDSSIDENIKDNNILDPILDFVSTLFSSKPSDQAKPTPLDFQNSMRDPKLRVAKENGLKDKNPLKEKGNGDKNTHLKNDLTPEVEQPDNNSLTNGDQTEPMIDQHPQKEIGFDNEDKKQKDGNPIVNEDKDDTKIPENKEIKETNPEVNEKLPQNEETKEQKSETHEENKELKEEKPENKESLIEKPDNHDEQVPESKEQKPDVQDNEEDLGRHGIERPGVDFIKNSGTIEKGIRELNRTKYIVNFNGTKYNLLVAPGKVVLAKEYINANNQPVREVYVNGNMIEQISNKRKVVNGIGRNIRPTKTETKDNCDGTQGKFEDTIDFTKRFHRIYNDDLYLLSEVTQDSVHLKTVNKETGNLYEEKYTLGLDGKLIFQKINDAITCGKL